MIIQSPTPEIKKSLDFYKKLKFNILEQDDETLVSDGKVLLKINPERYARPGIILYNKNWSSKIEEVRKLVPVFDTGSSFIVTDSTGSWIYLLNGEVPSYSIKGECHSTLGNYAGMSLETISMSHSRSLWEIFGYKVTMGGPDEGWMTMGDSNGHTISFMHPNACPHLFYNPSLTYFNGSNNPKIIQEIRDTGITFTEEITFFNKNNEVDNVIVRDPGGLGFFIFNDG